MRLPYVPNPPNPSSENDKAIVDRIKQRRASAGLLDLDLALLHSPPVADGWNTFLSAIRTQTTLPPSIRETIICRIAVLNKAWYEWDQHVPLLRACDHVTDDYIEWVRTSLPKDAGPMLDERHEVAMMYADYMTKEVEVPDMLFAKLKEKFDQREIVEMTAVAAAYNCVSRFLVALDVGERNGRPVPLEMQR